MGVDSAMAAQPGPILCPCGQIEFSIHGLRFVAFGIASICGAPLPELVST
jgi:hypothetical protein